MKYWRDSYCSIAKEFRQSRLLQSSIRNTYEIALCYSYAYADYFDQDASMSMIMRKVIHC